MIKFYILLSITALAIFAAIFSRGVPAYCRIALLPLLLTLSEGIFHFEHAAPIGWANLALHSGVAAFVCTAALPRRNYRKTVLHVFAAGFIAVFICLLFVFGSEWGEMLLQSVIHLVALAGALFFFMEWIRPPFTSAPLKSKSFWAVGAVFSYHILRLAFLALPLIGERREGSLTVLDPYSADVTASLVYGLLLLVCALTSKTPDFEKKF